MNPAPAVELRGITKRFGNALANDNVSLTVARGEIHGVIGENGAGKSTLMKIAYGFYSPDAGEIWLNGKRAEIENSEDAIRRGVGMVHQHFMLVETLTVLENVILGAEPHRGMILDFARARSQVSELLERFQISLSSDALISDLSVGQQQQVEILKLLYRSADILILDEPTAVLTPKETSGLFDVLRGLRKEGKTIILVTHKMNDVLTLTDRVTVLRGGKKIGERETASTNRDELVRLMVGRDVSLQVMKTPAAPGKVVLKLENVRAKGARGEQALDGFSMEVRAGEIVGVAGVMGNGQSELEEVVTGLRAIESGSITFFGAEISNLSVKEIRRHGMHHLPERQPIGHVPEDRQRMGLVLDWSVEDNVLLGYQDAAAFTVGPWLKRSAIGAHTERLVEAFQIRPPRRDFPVRTLSGGNQQKVILARELDPAPKFALIAQPTRGVDIGAIEFIHRKIIELRSKGTAILLISAELEEIFSLSDRIVVLFQGRNMGESRPEETDEIEMGLWMTGGKVS